MVGSGTRNARAICGVEPAEQPQRQGDLSVGGQCRVTAGEDQPKPVILHGSHLRVVVTHVQQGGLRLAVVTGRLAAQPVDGAATGGGHDPAAGIGRQALVWPFQQGRLEGVLDRLLGELDAAEEADQCRDRPSVLLPKHLGDGFKVKGRLGHLSSRGPPGTDAPRPAATGRRLARPRQRGIQVSGLDDPEPAQLLPRLGKRTIGDEHLTIADPHHRHDACRM
jgi:hypothetical protein